MSAATLGRLASVPGKRGITVFARIDHGAGAAKADAAIAPRPVPPTLARRPPTMLTLTRHQRP
jgi:hypothetical protein